MKTPSNPARRRNAACRALAMIACLILAGGGGPDQACGAQPNVILIVADDVAWHDLHVQGAGDLLTPAIDSLATGGVRFLNAYATAPVCSPSRAGLLTGRHQQRFGHETNPGESLELNPAFGLPLTESTMGDRLRGLGYATAWIGKSHLGAAPGTGPLSAYHPLNRGFDRFFGFLGSHRLYYDNPASTEPDPDYPIWNDATKIHEPEYLTDAFAREVTAFIQQRRQTAPHQPFFVFAPFSAAHFDSNQELKYPDDVIADLPDALFASTGPMRRDFARVMLALDNAVATILNTVDQLGLAENTLIIFTSDNGGDTLFGGINQPLRGRKTELYEGGVRVPLLMRWTNHLPSGVTRRDPVSQLDILPTVVAAGGNAVPAAWQLDGANLLPYATGAVAAGPHQTLCWRVETNGENESAFGVKDGLRAIRQGDWKLVKPSIGAPWQLFNLGGGDSTVPELNDLAAQQPGKVAEMAAAWEAWNAGLARPLWAVDNLDWESPDFVRDDIRLGDPAVSYQDPEFRPDAPEVSFQDATRSLWRGAVDPAQGWLVSATGKDAEVDTGLAPLGLSIIGARWGRSAAGAALYYTKGGTAGPLSLWRAGPGAEAAGPLLGSAALEVSAPRVSQDATAGSVRLLVKTSTAGGPASTAWATEVPAAPVAPLPFHAGGERNGVWIPGTTDVVYIGYPGGVPGTPQILQCNTSTGAVSVISTDAGAKSEACVFRAPELNGEWCYAAVVDRTSVAIYGGSRPLSPEGRARVATLTPPPAAPLRFLYDLKPLAGARGWNGTSWFTVSAFANNNPTAPGATEILLMGLGPDAAHRVIRRLDAGPAGTGFDPETLLGAREVFCWYSHTSTGEPVQLRRARTGLQRPDHDGQPSGFTTLRHELDFRSGPGLTPANRSTETTSLVRHGPHLFAAQGSSGRFPLDGGEWTGARVLTKTSPTGPWTLDGDFPGHLTVAAMASIPFTVRSNQQPLPPGTALLVASLQDFSPLGSTVLSVRTRISEGNWQDSHIPNPSGVAGYPTSFGAHQRIVPGQVSEWIFAGLSSGRIHRGVLNEGAAGLITWEGTPELTGTGPVLGFARANGLLYAACSLRQNLPAGEVAGGLYVRNDVNAAWHRVYQWNEPGPMAQASPDALELRGLTAVPNPRGGSQMVLLAARPWTGCIERIDPTRDHAVTVELDVRDFLARRWQDESIREMSAVIAFTGFTPAVDPVTGKTVHLTGVGLARPGPTAPVYLIRHADGTWEEASVALPGVLFAALSAAVRSIAVSPFPPDAGMAFYFGGGEAVPNLPDGAWLSRAEWSQLPQPAITSLQANTVELAWPATSPEWRLETSPSMLPGSWQPATGMPARSIEFHSLALPLDGTRHFYRMARPQ